MSRRRIAVLCAALVLSWAVLACGEGRVGAVGGDDPGADAVAAADALDGAEEAEAAPVGVKLSPAEPRTGDTLLATVTLRGAGDLAYGWWRNGAPLADLAGPFLGSEYTAKGDLVEVRIVDAAGSEASDSVVVRDTPPVVAGVVLVPTEPLPGDELSCVPAGVSDADGDEVALTFAWEVDGAIREAATDDTIDTKALSRDQVVRCGVTPDDGEEPGETVWSDAVPLGNRPPSIEHVEIAPLEGDQHAVFVCTSVGADDPDGDPVTVTIDWKVDGALAAGSHEESFPALGLLRGSEVVCEATPNDGEEDGPTVVSQAARVLNTAPTVGSVVIPPAEGALVSCVANDLRDPDGDEVTLSWLWAVNGETVDGEQGETFDTSDLKNGDEVTCAAVPSDQDGPGDATWSKNAHVVVATCDEPSDYTAVIWPHVADVTTCNESGGDSLPSTGPGAAYWFEWGGCGSWKEYPAEPGVPVFIHTYTDTCGGCVLWHINFEIQEDSGAGWTTLETYDPEPDFKGMFLDLMYTPHTSAFRIVALDGFYVRVYGCP